MEFRPTLHLWAIHPSLEVVLPVQELDPRPCSRAAYYHMRNTTFEDLTQRGLVQDMILVA